MEKTKVTPTVGGEYLAFGQKDSPFRILEEVNEEHRQFLVKNMKTGWEVYAFEVECYSDGTIEWERSCGGRFR